MSLPLLNGMSRSKLLEIVGKTKFHFVKFAAGERIVNAGDPCTHLRFLLSGSVKSTTIYTNGSNGSSISVTQTMAAPSTLCIEHLFGPTTCYPCNVTTIENVNGLQISKADYIKLIANNQILNFNFLNALSALAQNKIENCAVYASGNINERIAYFIDTVTTKQSKDIIISPVNNSIADFFGCSESDFNASLVAFSALGLTNCSDSDITIRSRDEFLSLFRSMNKNKIS